MLRIYRDGDLDDVMDIGDAIGHAFLLLDWASSIAGYGIAAEQYFAANPS